MTVLLWVLLVVPLVSAAVLLVVPRLLSVRVVPYFGLALAGVALAASLGLAIGFDYEHAGHMQFVSDLPWIPPLDINLRLGIDGLSLAMVLLTTILVFCCMLYTTKVRPEPGRLHALAGLIFLLELGMLGTFVSLDLVVFFVFFEVVLVPMWFVIAIWGDPHDAPGRRKAATTFLLYTVLGSALMLVGFLLIYSATGSFDMIELAEGHGRGISTAAQVAAALTIGLGLAVKTPMWPLHSWLPDAHAKAPTIGSVLLAGVLLKMGTYGFVRVWLPLVPEGARILAPYLAGFAVVGIIYGAFACLAQTELKRLIAYSSVGHMGFVLLGIATLAPVGVNGGVFAGIAHGLITGLLFFMAGAIKDRYGTGDLDVLGSARLYGAVPRLGGLFAFGAIASLGLPGLAGFWGEMLALFGAFDPGAGLGRPLYLAFMVFAGIGAVLTAWYFLALIRKVAQGAPSSAEKPPPISDLTRVEVWAWSPLVVGTLVLGLLPKPLLELTEPVVQRILGGAG